MSTRKLRPRVNKKDYSKMAAGETSEESGNESMRENQNNNKLHNGGSIIGEELFIHESDSLDNGEGSQSDVEITDAEVADVEKRLKQMKLEEKRLKKIEKYRRLSQEAEEVEKSIRRLSKKNKTSSKEKKKIDNVALRGMKDVMAEVDKLMDDKVRKNKYVESSSSDDSSDENVDSTSEDSDIVMKKRKVAKSKKGTGKKSGKCKSGKDKKITSLVKKQEDWPHTYLGLHFINQKKDYEDLTLAEFCAGYAAILEECSGSLLVNRIAHFKELMYLATKYQWKNVMNYHGAVLLEIERGHLQWGDSFQVLQNTTLAGGFLNASQFTSGGLKRRVGSSVMTGGNNEGQGIVFCKAYQRSACSHTSDHKGDFKGEIRLLKHICGNCWLIGKKMAAHPDRSEICPYFASQTQEGS